MESRAQALAPRRAEREAPGRARPRTAARGEPGRRRSEAFRVTTLLTLLVVVGILVYGDHVREGGWVGDAWVTRAWYALHPQDGFIAMVGHFLDLNSMGARPANAVYRVALNGWFGGDTGAWFAWQLASGILMCVALYALLRTIDVANPDATAISTLLLVFPASAAMWLWSPIAHASIAIAIGAFGFLLALRAFRQAPGIPRVALHLASVALFVLSLLLYEVCLPIFLSSVLLYRLRAPRRAAIGRWLLDSAVLLPIALLVTSSTEARDQGVAGSIDHAGEMAGQLPSLLFDTLLPFGSAQALGVTCLAAVYALSFVALGSRVASDSVRARLRRLLDLAAAGLVVLPLGYLIYVPGLDYYLPLAQGIGDRVNAVAAIGWVVFLYATVALAATLTTIRLRRASLTAGIVTAALTICLGLSWVGPISRESDAYVAAVEESDRVLDVVQRAIPDPPDGSAIWLFGQPVEISDGVPVFANYWNMTAAVALQFDNPRVRGFVAFPGTSFECRAAGVVPGGHFEYPAPAPGELGRFGSGYGRTYFVDTVRGQYSALGSRRDCMEFRDAFARSPQILDGAAGSR